MRRKIVLAIVLCLIAAAALGIGAAPALAADGCTCHTAVPPTDGAPAVGAPLVVGVDCTTCHRGMTVPHPELVKPTLFLGKPHTEGLSHHVHGGLSRPWLPLAGVVVYLQTREPTGTVYTDAGKSKTDARGFYVLGFGGPVSNLVPRTISQGLAGPPVVMPAISVPTVARHTPTLTLRLSGLNRGSVKLGDAVRAAGKVTPTDMAGQKVVRLKVQKWVAALFRWSSWWSGKYHPAVKRTISATGAYSWMYTPKHPGLYRVRASIADTSAYKAALTDWRRFRVK